VTILVQQSDGTHVVAGELASTGFVWSCLATDLDGDGHVDLVVPNQSTASIDVRMGDGSGAFNTAVTIATGHKPQSVVARDLDGDGLLDLSVPCNSGDGVMLHRGLGSGAFVLVDRIDVPFATSIAFADMDGDGLLDAAIQGSFTGDTEGTVTLARGDGTGHFDRIGAFAVGKKAVLGDFDEDGMVDVVGAMSASSGCTVFTNQLVE
jgi:hypothetical protein